MKKTRITYNPYENTIDINSAPSLEDSWQLLPDKSPLLSYVKTPSLFSNCVLDIVEKIDKGQNSSRDGLEIQFRGTNADFRLLEETVRDVDARRIGAGPLSVRRTGIYPSADEAVSTIRACYARIASEFRDFLPGGLHYAGHEELGDAIVKFEGTISDEVPVCFVGNYSVGKSALINAIIGDEVMPSAVNPTTARNVKIAHNPESCCLTICRTVDSVIRYMPFAIEDASMHYVGADDCDAEWADHFLLLVKERIPLQGKSANAVLHDILSLLNNTTADDDAILREIGMNVLVEVPFASSPITALGREVVFYDTPGSNNSDVNQEEHQSALQTFLTSQTNALPIVTTMKQSIMSNDNLELRRLLDRYKTNFSSLNSLIVIAQCDKLSSTELASKVSENIKTWHGMTPVLYTTAVGALGERKGKDSSWIDVGLAEGYRQWVRLYEEDPVMRTLPKYNLVPRSNAEVLSALADCPPSLFATGLPSLECEIMRYALEYADYKKCERGRRDLLSSLALVRDDIEGRKLRLEDQKELSERRRDAAKGEILKGLSAIQLESLDSISDTLYKDFEGAIDECLARLRPVVSSAYDEVLSSQALDLDEFVDARIRDYCQRELIDRCYLGDNGIQERIVASLRSNAGRFADELHRFIEGNDAHFTASGRAALEEIVLGDESVPTIEDVTSRLPALSMLFQVFSAAQYNLLMAFGDEEGAKNVWVDSRCNRLREILKDGMYLPGIVHRGEFSKTAILEPVASYDAQLREWAVAYREVIENCIDRENSVLSGMEEAIAKQEMEIVDLEGRVIRLDDAERELKEILELVPLDDVDGGASHVK